VSRFYQHVLTGERVEVKTLDEDDFYVANSSVWARVEEPASVPTAEEQPKKPAAKAKAGATEAGFSESKFPLRKKV
jgi:hypothetical protein